MSDWQCSRCWRKYPFEEFHLLPHCWVKPKDHKFGRTTVCFCGAIFHKDRWHLTSFIDEYRVSTVHLNLGHPDPQDFTNDDWLYFETMIDKREDFLSFQARYKSMDDAIEGHFLAVDSLPKILLDPEKYPISIIDKFFNAGRAYQKRRKLE